MLYLVATPIGNLSDISQRAIETLAAADYVVSEDTRKTGRLLAHFEIKKQQISFHEHNERRALGRIVSLLEQGKTTKSPVPRRRLAAQLAQLRKDIARQNTAAAMLNQQINIISTDIHNLTLIQQGEMAKLPEAAELTENAVKAEEMLESLKADSELVGSLESGMEETLASEEELAILREFEEADEKPVAKEDEPPPKAAVSEAPSEADRIAEPPTKEQTAPEPQAGKESRDAEAT